MSVFFGLITAFLPVADEIKFIICGVAGIGLIVSVIGWCRAHRREKGKALVKPKEPQPVIVAIGELKSLLYEGERLVGRFQEDSIKPTFQEVEDWRNRMLECAQQNVLTTESLVTAKDIIRLKKKWDQDDLLRIGAKFVAYGCVEANSTDLAVFQHLWGSVERLKQLIAKIEAEESDADASSAWKDIQGFRIEALAPIADLANITQVSWERRKKVIFTGDAALRVKNVLPAQGIDLVSFRLLSITPPMDAVKVWEGHTQDAILECIDFSADIPATLVAGKASTVKLFKVTRPLAAKSLKDVSVEFYGKWPDERYAVFTPQERHEIVVEVTGKGVSREEATFQLRFSCNETEPVFSIKTIRPAVGRA